MPDTFHILTGEVPDGFVHDEASLIRSSEECLADLPSLVDEDARAWTGSIGEKRTRHVRLMTTRLKPAVRATLVGVGEAPLTVWWLPWPQLVERWRDHDLVRAHELDALLVQLMGHPRDDRACGEKLLQLLHALASD